MKTTGKWTRTKVRSIAGLMLAVLYPFSSMSQVPKGVPQPSQNTPIDFTSVSDIIIYVVIPVVLVVIYLYWRINSRKKAREEEKRKMEEDNPEKE